MRKSSSRYQLILSFCLLLYKEKDIVLTRQDYLRFNESRGCLASVVESIMLTSHLLFVGFRFAKSVFYVFHVLFSA